MSVPRVQLTHVNPGPQGEVWGAAPASVCTHMRGLLLGQLLEPCCSYTCPEAWGPSPSPDGLALSTSPDPHDASDTIGPQFAYDENNRVLRLAIKIK